MKLKVILCACVLMPVFTSADYAECILENMKGVGSDVAAQEIKKACEQRFIPSGAENRSESSNSVVSEQRHEAVVEEEEIKFSDVLQSHLDKGDFQNFAVDAQNSVQKLIIGKDLGAADSRIKEISDMVLRTTNLANEQKINFLRPYLAYYVKRLSFCNDFLKNRVDLQLIKVDQDYLKLAEVLADLARQRKEVNSFVEMMNYRSFHPCMSQRLGSSTHRKETLTFLLEVGAPAGLVSQARLELADSLLLEQSDSYEAAYKSYYDHLSSSKKAYQRAELLFPQVDLLEETQTPAKQLTQKRLRVTTEILKNGKARGIDVVGRGSIRQKRWIKDVFEGAVFRPALLEGSPTLSEYTFEISVDKESPFHFSPDKRSFLMRANPSKAQAGVICGSVECAQRVSM